MTGYLQEDWFLDLREVLCANWEHMYLNRNSEITKRRAVHFRVRGFPIDEENQVGYPTDQFIATASTLELLDHMGIPRYVWPLKPRTLPDDAKSWLQSIQFRHRPVWEDQQAQPALFGNGIVLYGPSGTGKTVIASDLLRRLVELRIRNTDPTLTNRSWHGQSMGRFVDWQYASELFRRAVRSQSASEEADLLKASMVPAGDVMDRADFLVLDDISRERATEFNSGELHRILRTRFNQGWTTIITTNHNPVEWPSVYGDVLSKFMNRSFDKVQIA